MDSRPLPDHLLAVVLDALVLAKKVIEKFFEESFVQGLYFKNIALKFFLVSIQVVAYFFLWTVEHLSYLLNHGDLVLDSPLFRVVVLDELVR